jgi:hypothetical protein
MKNRKVVSVILYVALLLAGVFAALQIHAFLENRQHVRSVPAAKAFPLARNPRGPESGPAATHPLAVAGLTAMEWDPGGFRPPAGAVRRMGLQRVVEDYLEQTAEYECDRYADFAAGHYRDSLARAGFALRKEGPEPGGGRIMIFTKDAEQVVIVLRKNPPSAKIVVIVTDFRPK